MSALPPSDPLPVTETPAAAVQAAARWSDWLLGRDPRQRVRAFRSLLALLGYCVGALLLQFGVHTDSYRLNPLHADLIGLWSLLGGGCFFIAQRSGITRRLRHDPSLTQAQILFGFSVIALMYAIAGPGRGAVLIMLQLILVFGIFNLSGRQAWGLSLVCILIMGCTMLAMALGQPLRYPPDQEFVHFAIMATAVPMMAVLTGQIASLRERLKRQRLELRAAAAHNLRLAQHDALTQLYNRGYMQELLARYAQQHHTPPLIITLIDVDHFKTINDSHGHSVGDAVLIALAQHMQQALPSPHVVSRWGGEEFLVLSPLSHRDQVSKSLEVLRVALKQRPLLTGYPDLEVTFSAGVATHREDETLAQTLTRADQALYTAKADGRDVMRIASRF
ncbi:GGDEF domain-containing protein [Amphibiibacter pelophylacis]|uniref:GGDEF domain-containing protein n=1 Tax=Amphibiibacter pelophylacis TaxID=1799477 RepID=A0ACC6P0C9_9BURK